VMRGRKAVANEAVAGFVFEFAGLAYWCCWMI